MGRKEIKEPVAVVTGEPVYGAKPHKAFFVLRNVVYEVGRQPAGGGKVGERILLGLLRNRNRKQAKCKKKKQKKSQTR